MAISSKIIDEELQVSDNKGDAILESMRVCMIGLQNLPVLAEEFAGRDNSGGEQVQQTLIAKALQRRGYEVSMVTLDYGQTDGAAWHGISVFKAYRSDGGIRGIRFVHPRSTGLWSALSRANADVYYTSCAGFPVGIAALFCQIKRRGLVFRLASDSDADPKKLLIRYTRDKKIYEYGLRRAHVVLSQHAGQQADLIRNFGVDSTVADMLVETPQQRRRWDQRDIDVLWVSNLRQLKRPDLFLDLSERCPEVRMHMVGGPDPSNRLLYEITRRRASSLSNTEFHGQIPYFDVGSIYDRSRVFVNTSEIEGFPNSFLQSWCRGIPVVSFFDPNGLIRREGLGYIVQSVDEMRLVVQRILSDINEWLRISDRCVRYMERFHSDDLVLSPYLRAISDAYQLPAK